jgi:hypothetical protein
VIGGSDCQQIVSASPLSRHTVLEGLLRPENSDQGIAKMNQVMANSHKTAMDLAASSRLILDQPRLTCPGLYLIGLRQHLRARERPNFSEASFVFIGRQVRCNHLVTLATRSRNTVTQGLLASE